MALDTPSVNSDSSYTWESLLNQKGELITYTTTLRQESMDEVNKGNQRVFGTDGSFTHEEFQVGQEDNEDELIASCNDLDWDQRSAMSSFSLYLSSEDCSCVSALDVSLLDGKSFDCGATKVTEQSDVGSALSSDELVITDITFHRTGYESSEESVMTEDIHEIYDEDTVESEFEVKSFASEATDYGVFHSEYGSAESVTTEVHEIDEEDTVESEFEVKSLATEVIEASGVGVFHSEYRPEESATTEVHERDEADTVESEYEVKSLVTEAIEAADAAGLHNDCRSILASNEENTTAARECKGIASFARRRSIHW